MGSWTSRLSKEQKAQVGQGKAAQTGFPTLLAGSDSPAGRHSSRLQAALTRVESRKGFQELDVQPRALVRTKSDDRVQGALMRVESRKGFQVHFQELERVQSRESVQSRKSSQKFDVIARAQGLSGKVGWLEEFPDGAAGELYRHQKSSTKQQFETSTPPAVATIISDNGAEAIYDEFVKDLAFVETTPVGRYDANEVYKKYETHVDKFKGKNIGLYIGYRITGVQSMWFVYVDLAKAPDYKPNSWDGLPDSSTSRSISKSTSSSQSSSTPSSCTSA